ncbi:MAG: hypothetical protein K6G15_01360 [Desulfovibrio sp.]|nr:hypothetical protein [Desulfovibrio sp.]
MQLPTTDELTKLFKTSKNIKHNNIKILREHYNSPNYTTTATELAEKLGYKSFSGINGAYGNFVKKLAIEYGWTEEDKKREGFCWLYFILDFENKGKIGEHWKLILRETTIHALKNIGW